MEQIIKKVPKTEDWQIQELYKREFKFAKEIVRVLDEKANKGCKVKGWVGFQNGNGDEIGTEIEKIISKAKKTIENARKTSNNN